MVAEAIGRSRSSITNLLRLLELSTPVLARLEGGELDMGHARALRALEEENQIAAALEVISKQLNTRQTEALVRRLKRERNTGEDKAKTEKPMPKSMGSILISRSSNTNCQINWGHRLLLKLTLRVGVSLLFAMILLLNLMVFWRD